MTFTGLTAALLNLGERAGLHVMRLFNGSGYWYHQSCSPIHRERDPAKRDWFVMWAAPSRIGSLFSDGSHACAHHSWTFSATVSSTSQLASPAPISAWTVSEAETDTPSIRDLYLGDHAVQILPTAKGLVLVSELNRLVVRQDPELFSMPYDWYRWVMLLMHEPQRDPRYS